VHRPRFPALTGPCVSLTKHQGRSKIGLYESLGGSSRRWRVRSRREGGFEYGLLLTITLNAAVDRTYTIPGFALNRVHRPAGFRAVAGGKGINVARVFKELGGHVVAGGFLGGHNGELIADGLRQEGIPAQFVWTREESRTCIAVIDPDAQTQTEVNENGPTVTAEEVRELIRLFADLLGGVQAVTLSGSLPPGCPDDIYATLISLARDAGVLCALDASGTPLLKGWRARPDIVKCNNFELSALRADAGTSVDDVTKAALSLLGEGTHEAIVTLGARGAVAAADGQVWYAPSPKVEFVSAVGSGDAFLAAYMWAKMKGENVPSCLAWGVAAGAANAAVYGAGFCQRHRIQELRATCAPEAQIPE